MLSPPLPRFGTQFPPTAGRDSKRSSAAASYPPIRRGCYYSCVRVPDRQHVDRPGGGRRGLAPAAARPRCALLSHIPGPRACGSHTEIPLVLGERHSAARLPRACDRRAPARDAAVRAGLFAPGVRVTVQSQRHRDVRAVQLVPAPGQAAQAADAGPRHAARPRVPARARARDTPLPLRSSAPRQDCLRAVFEVKPRVPRNVSSEIRPGLHRGRGLREAFPCHPSACFSLKEQSIKKAPVAGPEDSVEACGHGWLQKSLSCAKGTRRSL